MSPPKVVLAHDWLTGMRGGERVLEQLCRMFPDAPVYTLLHERGTVSPAIERRRVVTSWLQRLPAPLRGRYRGLLPLMPAAVGTLRVEPCDLLLSVSHCAIKSLRPPPGARHLCYVLTPMRYVWDQRDAYFGPGRAAPATRALAWAGIPALRRWDAATAARVDRFVAISREVAARVRSAWGRSAGLVHPPVELERFEPTPTPNAGGYFLMVTAFAPYKRVDVALEAFRRLGLPLKVVGGGQDAGRLWPLFGGSVEWLGARSDEEVAALYRGCRAFVMPGEEDFGLTPLEAQASGRPVIALGRGGVLDTVVPLGADSAPTGVLYGQDGDDGIEGLAAAVQRFVAAEGAFDPGACRRQAERFSPEAFRTGLGSEIDRLLAEPGGRL